jgi:O-antigen/teichoic acid export membrane protein
MYFAVTNYVFHAGATARLAAVTASSGFVSIVTTYVLIRNFGLLGAGYGFAISQAVLFLGTWRLAQRVCPMPWLAALRPTGRMVNKL